MLNVTLGLQVKRFRNNGNILPCGSTKLYFITGLCQSNIGSKVSLILDKKNCQNF